MKIQSLFIVSLLSFFCAVAYAEQATGLCKDGTEYTGDSKRGACRGHKGLKEWYADKATAAPTSPTAATPATAPAPAAANGAATGLCKDGTPYTGSSKRGACRGHKGLQEWYADKQAATTAAPATAPIAAAPGTSVSGMATGLCKDGTTYTGSSKRGACRGHKGLQEWYADKQAATTAAPATAPIAAAPGTSVSGMATGLCKDGTTYTGSSKRGACRGHKGLQEWYADKQAAPAAVQSPDAAPSATATNAAPSAAATGICKDGTEYTGTSKRGACRGHKGIKEWFGDKTAPAATPAPAPAAQSTTPAPAQPTQPAPQATAAPATTPAQAQAAAPVTGGGPGLVWANTRSKIYHCQGSKFYGNTKEGEYMTEAQAQAKGFNANRKKTCSINQ